MTIDCNCPECGEHIGMELDADDVLDADTINVECPMCGFVFEAELIGSEKELIEKLGEA